MKKKIKVFGSRQKTGLVVASPATQGLVAQGGTPPSAPTPTQDTDSANGDKNPLHTLGKSVSDLLLSAANAIQSSSYLLEQITACNGLEALNQLLNAWAMEPVEIVKKNESAFADLKVSFTGYKSLLAKLTNSQTKCSFFAEALNNSHKVIIASAKSVNAEHQKSSLDKQMVQTVLAELQTLYDETDEGKGEELRCIAATFDELSAPWPFKMRNLSTIRILGQLTSDTGKKFLTMYKNRGPKAVRFFL